LKSASLSTVSVLTVAIAEV